MAPRRVLPAVAPARAREDVHDTAALPVGGIDYTAFDHLATLVAVV